MDKKTQASKIQNVESLARNQSIVKDWERQAYKIYNREASIFSYSKNQLLKILNISRKIPQLRRASYQVHERIKDLILNQQILALKQQIKNMRFTAIPNSKSKKTLPKNIPKSEKQIEHKNAQLPAKTSTWFSKLQNFIQNCFVGSPLHQQSYSVSQEEQNQLLSHSKMQQNGEFLLQSQQSSKKSQKQLINSGNKNIKHQQKLKKN